MNKILKFSRFKDIDGAALDDSYFSTALKRLRESDIKRSSELESFILNEVLKNNKVIQFDDLVKEEKYVGVFVIGNLEKKRLIHRLPASDLYIKCDPQELLPLGHHLNLSTIREIDFLNLRRFEFKILLRELGKNNNSSDKNTFSEIFEEKWEFKDNDPHYKLTGSLLEHFEKYGILPEEIFFEISRQNLRTKELSLLNESGAIMRLVGSCDHIYFVQSLKNHTNSFITVESVNLNTEGIKKVISIESESILAYLRLMASVIPRLSFFIKKANLNTVDKFIC